MIRDIGTIVVNSKKYEATFWKKISANVSAIWKEFQITLPLLPL